MDCFCKGTTFGLIAGMLVGAIIVAKNKNLSNMIKEKSEIAGKKISEVANSVKDSFAKKENKQSENCHETNNCNCQNNFVNSCGQNGQYYDGQNGCHC